MFVAIAGCATARVYTVPLTQANGFMRCADHTLRVQLRYTVTRPNTSTIVAQRATGDRRGRIIVAASGRGERREIEIRPDGAPGSDRDALIRRCESYLK